MKVWSPAEAMLHVKPFDRRDGENAEDEPEQFDIPLTPRNEIREML